MNKQGYVIARAKSLKEYFTTTSAYDRPQWVALDEASTFQSPDLAQQAVRKLWKNGEFAAKVIPLQEISLDMEVPADDEAGDTVDVEMTADTQEDPSEDPVGVCPECSCDPCECQAEDEVDGSSVDKEEEEDPRNTLLGQHLAAAAQEEECSQEGEERAHMHPDEVKMMGRQRADMKEAAMPARPGNDPAKPTENDTTAATMKEPKADVIDFKDPVGQDDKPETNLDHATSGEDADKVKVPAEVMSALKAKIAEFDECAKENDKVNDTKGSFCMTVADALRMLQADLECGTVVGIKNAQIHMTSFMNPITSHIPEEVAMFIVRGGRKPSLKDYFDVKWDKLRGVK